MEQLENNTEKPKQKVILFSTRDIVEIYPNNIGLQYQLRQFINQIKIKSLTTKMLKVNSHGPKIKVGYYIARKFKIAIEEYIEKTGYKLCAERKESMLVILDIINNKIKKESEDLENV